MTDAPAGATINESWPYYDLDEIEAVREVLASGKVNQWTGERVSQFEAAMAARLGVRHAVALANGSVGLELALRALGIGPGHEVIVTARSFIASASCVAMVGAEPRFADVHRDSQNITPETIAPLITPRTKAVIPVHLAGWPADMPGIMELAKAHGLSVIEDCAQSLGAEIDGKPAGAFGDAAVLSFCQDKIMSTGGEGGMALFRDDEAYARAWSFKDHGKSLDLIKRPSDGARFRYVHESIGTNWRMTEMQAAIGLVQLTKLDAWLARRAENARIWADALAPSPALRVPRPEGGIRHAHYKLYAIVAREGLRPGTGRDEVLAALGSAGVRVFTGACPEIYREGAFAAAPVEPARVARRLGETSLMFEVHPTLDAAKLAITAARARAIIAGFERG